MKIPDQDIAALQALGYTEIEARFLYIVATHSGYFVPRQYLAFSGVKWGHRTNHFAGKLESQGHAYWREYEGVRGVYHLFSKPLYAKIGKDNLRNRRRHSVEFIKTRLILLDFILANPQYDYLETEQEKVRYFCEQLQVPKSSLPTKVYLGSSRTEPTLRYFVDKYPLFVGDLLGSSSPVITFSYVDPGYAGIAGFANHLNDYHPLFLRLPAFRFVYIAIRRSISTQTEERFPLIRSPRGRCLRISCGTSVCSMGDEAVRSLQNAEIEWLNELQAVSATNALHLFILWLSGQVNDETVPREFMQASPQKQVHFATYLVNRNRSWPRNPPNQQKCASAPHFRPRNFSLQPCAEANFAERNDILRQEKTRKDAAG
jgi:hypothetical protein